MSNNKYKSVKSGNSIKPAQKELNKNLQKLIYKISNDPIFIKEDYAYEKYKIEKYFLMNLESKNVYNNKLIVNLRNGILGKSKLYNNNLLVDSPINSNIKSRYNEKLLKTNSMENRSNINCINSNSAANLNIKSESIKKSIIEDSNTFITEVNNYKKYLNELKTNIQNDNKSQLSSTNQGIDKLNITNNNHNLLNISNISNTSKNTKNTKNPKDNLEWKFNKDKVKTLNYKCSKKEIKLSMNKNNNLYSINNLIKSSLKSKFTKSIINQNECKKKDANINNNIENFEVNNDAKISKCNSYISINANALNVNNKNLSFIQSNSCLPSIDFNLNKAKYYKINDECINNLKRVKLLEDQFIHSDNESNNNCSKEYKDKNLKIIKFNNISAVRYQILNFVKFLDNLHSKRNIINKLLERTYKPLKKEYIEKRVIRYFINNQNSIIANKLKAINNNANLNNNEADNINMIVNENFDSNKNIVNNKNYQDSPSKVKRNNNVYIDLYSKFDNTINDLIIEFNNSLNSKIINKSNLKSKLNNFIKVNINNEKILPNIIKNNKLDNIYLNRYKEDFNKKYHKFNFNKVISVNESNINKNNTNNISSKSNYDFNEIGLNTNNECSNKHNKDKSYSNNLSDNIDKNQDNIHKRFESFRVNVIKKEIFKEKNYLKEQIKYYKLLLKDKLKIKDNNDQKIKDNNLDIQNIINNLIFKDKSYDILLTNLNVVYKENLLTNKINEYSNNFLKEKKEIDNNIKTLDITKMNKYNNTINELKSEKPLNIEKLLLNTPDDIYCVLKNDLNLIDTKNIKFNVYRPNKSNKHYNIISTIKKDKLKSIKESFNNY